MLEIIIGQANISMTFARLIKTFTDELTGEVSRYKREEEARSQEIYQLVTEAERYKQDIIRLRAEVGYSCVRSRVLSRALSALHFILLLWIPISKVGSS